MLHVLIVNDLKQNAKINLAVNTDRQQKLTLHWCNYFLQLETFYLAKISQKICM